MLYRAHCTSRAAGLFPLPPFLDPEAAGGAIQPRYALLINPFDPKDPQASFGKHVLTPALALEPMISDLLPESSARRFVGWPPVALGLSAVVQARSITRSES